MGGQLVRVNYTGLATPAVPESQRIQVEKENKKVLKDYNVQFKIFENQALSAYTMKTMHLIVKPEIIIIPGIFISSGIIDKVGCSVVNHDE